MALFNDSKDQAPRDDDSLRYIRELLDNSYFHRIWTIQEVAMAKEAIVVCGELETPWKQFAEGGSEFINSEPSFTRFEGGEKRFIHTDFHTRFFKDHYLCSRWKTLASMSTDEQEEAIQEEGDARLHQLRAIVSTAHSHEASEPKDRVFGLYRLFLDLNIPLAAPVYNTDETIESVYIAATKAIIRGTKSMNILDNVVTRSREPALPSWVQEFRYEQQYIYTKLWTASGALEVDLKRLDASVGGQLETDGFIVGQVSRRGATSPIGRHDMPPVPSTDTEFPTPRWIAILECFRGWMELIDEKSWDTYVPTGEKPLEALFQLLLSQLNKDGIDELDLEEAYEFWHSTIRKLNEAPLSDDKIVALMEFSGATSRWWNNDLDIMHFLEMVDKDMSPDVAVLLNTFWQYNYGRCLFLTKSGYLGIGDGEIQPNDSVVIFAGATMPMVLRPDGSSWRLIGPAILHGAMDGQLCPGEKGAGPTALKQFSIV